MPRRASAATYSGCSFVVKMAFIASVMSSAGRMPCDLAATRRTSPLRDRHDDLDELQLGAGHDCDAHLAVDGIAGLPLRERRPCRARAARRARTSAPSGTRPVGAHDRDRAFDLVAGQHVERMRAIHVLLRACQRVSTTRTISAYRPSGSPASCRDRRSPSRAPSRRSPPGSCIWLLCDSSASILRSTASVMSV